MEVFDDLGEDSDGVSGESDSYTTSRMTFRLRSKLEMKERESSV